MHCRGITLTIEASGSTSDVIAAGSMVDVVVKYGKYVTILNQSFDLCDNVNQVDQECPIDQGRYVLSKSVDIPSGVPAVSSIRDGDKENGENEESEKQGGHD